MPAGFEQLYERFAGDVRRWVRAFGAKSADVEDLAHDVEGKERGEISRLQNVPVHTVWARAHRARGAVREASRRLDLASARRRR